VPAVPHSCGTPVFYEFYSCPYEDLVREGDAAVDAFAHRRWLVMHQDQYHLPHVRASIEALATFFVDTVPTLS